MPVLLPELANPLYLKLVCGTLQAKGYRSLPLGWHGLAPVIQEFLAVKERSFSQEHDVSVGTSVVSRSLAAIARQIARSGQSDISWAAAYQCIIERLPHVSHLPILEWLVREELLIEDGPFSTTLPLNESVLRLAFERFGDLLVATDILAELTRDGISPEGFGGALAHLVADSVARRNNAGVLSALSIVLPEYHGLELPHLADGDTRSELLTITIRSLPWRTPASFSEATEGLLRECLHTSGRDAVNAALAVSTYESPIDANWLNGFLSAIPLARRDGVWCAFLHESYNGNGIVKRLIDAADGVDLHKVEEPVAVRWAIVLLWFAAAADRRVKDHATRAAVDVVRGRCELVTTLIDTFIGCDDDEVVERMLLCV